jgi:hypothetical protein
MINYNEHFKNIKDIHMGKTALLFASGSSLNIFEDTFGDNVIRFAVNGVILHPEFRNNLDYYVWAGDINIPEHHVPSDTYIRDAIKYLDNDTKKYVCCWTNNEIIHPNWGVQTQISPEDASKLDGFNLFNQSSKLKNQITTDISINGLSGHSVIFQALNIIIYTGITKIILVGCDAGGEHSYDNIINNDTCDWTPGSLVGHWKNVRNFLKKEYPNVQIFNKNPIGLKNIFPSI